MIPARTWSSVLLPAPFGPMTPRDSPCTSLKLTSRSAQKSSAASCLNRLMKDRCSVVFLVNRRLYLMPMPSARIAAGRVEEGAEGTCPSISVTVIA